MVHSPDALSGGFQSPDRFREHSETPSVSLAVLTFAPMVEPYCQVNCWCPPGNHSGAPDCTTVTALSLAKILREEEKKRRERKEKPVLFKNVFDEEVKIMILFSQPLGTHLFDINVSRNGKHTSAY